MTDLVHSGSASIPEGDEAAGATMLERAARALSDHFKCEWETMRDTDREMIRGYVRAVLMAVREPGEAMATAATDGHDTYWNYEADGRPSGPCDTFTAIIDAILADGEGR